MRCTACDSIFHPAEIRDPITKEFIEFEPLCFHCKSSITDEDSYLDRAEEAFTNAVEGIKLPCKSAE